jgi:putative cell wall-binding protein
MGAWKSLGWHTGHRSVWRFGMAVAVSGCLLAVAPPVDAQSQPGAATPAWKQLHPVSAPSARIQANETYDPATGQLLVFSGAGGSTQQDTWTFDGVTWTKHVTTVAPSSRGAAGFAYDPPSKQVVLFKGDQYTSAYPSNGDTWTWNGSQWTLQHPTTTPPGFGGCMATDYAAGQLILFGGQEDNFASPSLPPYVYYATTWTWSNGNWTQLSPSASPPAGICNMAYDAGHHDLVLVSVDHTTGVAQTWTYDGTTWTQQHPVANPVSPYSIDFKSMTYDPDLGEVVTVGGENRVGFSTEVWGWDGTTWVQLPATPVAHGEAGAAYDDATRQLVISGGSTFSGAGLSDTWVLTPGGSATVTPTRVAGADRDATAVEVSHAQFGSAGSASAVVLARDDVFADALAGGPLAADKHGPLLLTPSSSLDPATVTELERALPAGGAVDVLGGPSAISDPVVSAISALGYAVQRVSGTDRFGTAIAIADALGDPATVFEASGADFPDALSAVPAAIASHAAIVLTNGSGQSSATAAYLTAHAATRYAIGGPAAWADPTAIALAGSDRYATSAEVAETFFPTAATTNVASGASFADALSGGVLAGTSDQPLLLAPPTGTLAQGDNSYLTTRHGSVTTMRIIGGVAAISESVSTALAAALR